MNLENSLTKENYFNELMVLYPNAMKYFCEWIDEYKKAVGWNRIFCNQPLYPAPKFHDLPQAMQLGIWVEFVCQRGGCSWEIEDMFSYDLREDIEGYFKNILEPELLPD